jgi:MFS family permease
MVLLVLFGGVVADRFRRDLVLVTSNFLCMATQAVAAGLLLSGVAEVWQIAVIEAVNGAAAAFSFPALQGIMPQLVARDELQQANALNGMVRNVTLIGGGVLGGAIVGFLGPGWGLSVNAVMYGMAALLIAQLRLGDRPTEGSMSRSTLHDLRAGWREFTARRWVWVIVLAFCFINAATAGAIHTLGPVIADQSFGRVGWGLLQSATGVGLVLGALIMLRWRPQRPLVIGMLGIAFDAPLMVMLGLDPSLVPLLLVAVLAGVGSDLFGIGWETSLQQHIPRDKLSRVASYDALGSFVAMPVGQIVAGPLASIIGTERVIVASGVIVGIVVALTIADPSVRGLRRLDVKAAEGAPAVPVA